MELQKKTLEKLRDLINEGTEYRSGPDLVSFFNDLGFNDSYNYGQGFPSRWKYTDEKLSKINGTPELDLCIKKLFSPINFADDLNKLDEHIREFNKFLTFDGWKVIRKSKDIIITRADEKDLGSSEDQDENEFLKKDFGDISIDKLGLDSSLNDIIKLRFEEIKNCLRVEAALSVVFLSGSSLEGILLGIALKFPKQYNSANSSPKDSSGKVKQFHEWTLNNYITVAHELGHLKEDVKKFSSALRDFRNYIHPLQQVSENFNPDKNTALICWQVLKAAIYQLEMYAK